MTEKPMPDVIWATVTPGVKTTSGYWSVIDKINPNRSNKQPRIKFIRAEPVEALLKQARDALSDIAVYGCGMFSQSPHMNMPEADFLQMRLREYERTAYNAMTAIDKLLGETK